MAKLKTLTFDKELIFAIPFLIIISPLIVMAMLIVLPLSGIAAFISWARKEPHPVIPVYLGESGLLGKELATAYVKEAEKLVEGLRVVEDKSRETYVLTSTMLKGRAVEIDYQHGIMSLQINGLNSYDWNSAEMGSNLDHFFWVAISALKNGVTPARSRLGRKVFWIQGDGTTIWMKVQKEGSSYDSIPFYTEPKL